QQHPENEPSLIELADPKERTIRRVRDHERTGDIRNKWRPRDKFPQQQKHNEATRPPKQSKHALVRNLASANPQRFTHEVRHVIEGVRMYAQRIRVKETSQDRRRLAHVRERRLVRKTRAEVEGPPHDHHESGITEPSNSRDA